MLFSGILSKYLTIGISAIVIFFILLAWYFSNEKNEFSCNDQINHAVNKAVTEERVKQDELKKFKESINSLDNDAVNQWLQSNDGLRD